MKVRVPMSAVAVAVHLLVVCMTISQVASQPFEIIQNRFDTNVVRLQCRRTNFSSLGSTISFFRNTSAGLSTTVIVHSADGTGVNSVEYIFSVIRLANEGVYSCGETTTGPDSNQVPVIAFPEHDFQVEYDGVTTIRAKAGSTAVLPSYIRPGNWHSRYYIDWYRDGRVVGRIVGLRSQAPIVDTTQDRFSVNPASFSLTINNVARSDIGEYFGMLEVTEGENYDGQLFDQTENMAIRLEVYEMPVVRVTRDSIVVSSENASTIVFECNATGYPRPTIRWSHKFSSDKVYIRDVITGNDSAYSRLILTKGSPEDSGKVGCYAIVEPGGNIAPLHSEMAVSNLSILHIFDVQVFRTTGDVLIFTILLGENVMIPEELRVEVLMEGDTMPQISPEVYQGISPITHFLEQPSEELLNSVVSVSISSSSGVATSLPFSRDLSMVAVQDCSFNREIVYIVVPVGALLIVVFLAFILVCYCVHNSEIHKRCDYLRELKNDPEATKEERREAVGYLCRYLESSSGCCSSRPTTSRTSSVSETRRARLNAYSESPQRQENGNHTSLPLTDLNPSYGVTAVQIPPDDASTPEVDVIRSKGQSRPEDPKVRKRKNKYKLKGCTEEEALALARNYFD